MGTQNAQVVYYKKIYILKYYIPFVFSFHVKNINIAILNRQLGSPELNYNFNAYHIIFNIYLL